jgi:hypothetical protein
MTSRVTRRQIQKKRMSQIRRIQRVDKEIVHPMMKARSWEVGRRIYAGAYVTVQISSRKRKGAFPRIRRLYVHGIGIVGKKGKIKKIYLFRKSRKKP